MKKNNHKNFPMQQSKVKDWTICESTAQMLEKSQKEGVETAFDRAAAMKPCPIGADSACCKHCAMGPCRLNSKDPYGKVGVCGATIDTIQARNFARMVACGTAAHSSHGRSMLNLFRNVVNGQIKDYAIKNERKLEEVAQSIGIETEGREIKQIALDLCAELERIFNQVDGEIPFARRVPPKTKTLVNRSRFTVVLSSLSLIRISPTRTTVTCGCKSWPSQSWAWRKLRLTRSRRCGKSRSSSRRSPASRSSAL